MGAELEGRQQPVVKAVRRENRDSHHISLAKNFRSESDAPRRSEMG